MKKKINSNNNNNNFKILGMPTQQTFSVSLETKPLSHQKFLHLLFLTVFSPSISSDFLQASGITGC